MPSSQKILRGHDLTIPGKMCVKFELRSVNSFGANETLSLTTEL